MVEFTGERIVPGKVDDDLLHEHVSRYRFASTLATDKICLDAGCGLGYGTAILGSSAISVVGVDIDTDSVIAASNEHRIPRANFSVADVCELPFADGHFDLSVSFEVVEHLHNWQGFLKELARVTSLNGIVLVSTPNRDYYAESRGESGPNPFHLHEFDYSEYLDALCQVFSHVRVIGQNVIPAISFFQDAEPAPIEAFNDSTGADVAQAQFYVAVCSHRPLPTASNFVYLASTGNVLMDRARHIHLLESEVLAKTQWLEKAKSELEALQRVHEQVELELKERSTWAIRSTEDLRAQNAKLASALDNKCEELEVAVAQLHEAERTIEERSNWARQLDAHNLELRERISHLDRALLEATESMASSIANAKSQADRLNSLTVALENNQHIRHREQSLLAELAGLDTTAEEPTIFQITEQLRSMIEGSRQQTEILEHIRSSRWLRLGRALGIGPRIR